MNDNYKTVLSDIEECCAAMGLTGRERTEAEKDLDECYAAMERKRSGVWDDDRDDLPGPGCWPTLIEGVSCYEKDGTAYLRLEDVARGLGFTEKKGDIEYIMWRRIDKYLADFGFGTCAERPVYIPENIFYRLAMKAKNETAEKFQALVADEIIPSIRCQGVYIGPDADPDTIIRLCQQFKALQDEHETLQFAHKFLQDELEDVRADRKALWDERDALTAAARRNAARLARLEPKGAFADAVSASSRSILVGELAKLLCQNGVDIGQNRLFDWLRVHGYLMADPKRSDYNTPTQRAMELGLFDIKETAVIHSDGRTTVTTTPKVTGKGQQYFVDYFLSGKAGPVTLPPRSRASRKKKGSVS